MSTDQIPTYWQTRWRDPDGERQFSEPTRSRYAAIQRAQKATNSGAWELWMVNDYGWHPMYWDRQNKTWNRLS